MPLVPTRRYRNPLKKHLAAHEVAVPDRLTAGTYPGRVFGKRCYSRAFYYFDAHRAAGAVLCHGWVTTVDYPFAHAWVELPDGLVFDGVVQTFYTLAGYHEAMRVRPNRVWRYTAAEVEELTSRTGHSGPWVKELEGATLGPSATQKAR